MFKCQRCGKFGFFFGEGNAVCEECRQAEFKSMYQEYKAMEISEEKIAMGVRLLSESRRFPDSVFPVLEKAGLMEPMYLSKGLDRSEFERQIHSSNERVQFLNIAYESHRKEVWGIPKHTVILNNSTHLEKKLIRDMPEITYSPVGAAFTFAKIPAFVVISLGKTGTKAISDKIIYISAVLYEDMTPISAFNVNIGIESTLEQVAEDFLRFIGKYPLLSYDLPYDLKFLWAAGIDVTQQKRKYYDVYYVCEKACRSSLHGETLNDACFAVGYHRPKMDEQGLSDCVTTVKVFEKSLEYI